MKAAASKALRMARARAGLCTKCGGERDLYRFTCSKCLASNAALQAAFVARNPGYFARYYAERKQQGTT